MNKTKQNFKAIGIFFHRMQLITILVLSIVMVHEKAFSQTSYTFTSAGAIGETGPTQSQINTAYTSTSLNGSVTINAFQGIQEFIIPAGSYSIEAWGAGINGGFGAKLGGTFNFPTSQKLYIAIGQQASASAGGQGGTYISMGTSVATSTPMLIAGGGGGNGGVTGVLENSATYTTSGNPGDVGFGGTNGFGGQCNTNNTTYGGGGGGGFYGDGVNTSQFSMPGSAFINGAAGGPIGSSFANTTGGFGGGGSGNTGLEPGGGGGYSGGGGGGATNNSSTGVGGGNRFGGGGSSYNSGISQYTLGINNNGNGKVVITAISAAALNFDGVNDLVNIGSAITNSLTGSTKVSVEAWVKPTSLSGLGCIVGNYSTGSAALQILLRRSGNSYYEFWVGNGSSWYNTNSVATPTVNVWQHVAATWDGTVASIYVNGVLSGSTTPAISTLGNASNNPVWIGANTINENFTGNVDEVRIWNIARTQCDINTYKNCEIPATATGLLANYHFNQGVDGGTNTSITTLTDATASAYTGTLTNMALTGTTSNWVASGGVISGSITPANLTITVGSTVTNSVICSGNSTTLSGSGANTYSWTNGVINAVVFSPTVTATYTVTGTNTLTGCSNTATNTVTVNATPTISVTSGAICAGKSFTMTPSGAATYTFSSGSAIVTPTITASYNVTGTSSQGCVSSNTAVSTVTVNALPTVSVTSGAICAGQSYTMTPSGATTYTYSSGSAIVTPTITASYNVTGTSTQGCVSSNTAISTVTINALPTIAVNSGSICAGQSFTMVPSGAATYTYSSGTAVVTPTVNASYNITGTDANGCISSSAAVSSITVNALPTITVSSGTVCSGESYTIVANGALTYTSVPSLAGPVVTPTVTTNYSITGTDANGCVNSNVAVSSVTVNTLPTISVNSSSICVGQSFTMTPSGATTYTYSSGSAVVTPTTNSSYSITGTSAQGCVSSNTAISTVTVNALPTVSVTSGAICSGKSFTMTPNGASTYTYSSGSAIVSPTANASYSVTGTSAQGCVSSNTAVSSVTVNALPMVMAATNSTLLCVGNSATLTASGATSYTWNTTATTAVIAVSPTTTVTYTVNGTGANGCSNAATVTQSVSACVGINVLAANDLSISVYPNPTNGLFILELNTTSQVSVTNALGEVIITETLNAGKHDLDIHNEATGIYFVKVIENNKQQVIKLIKQ